MPDTAQDVYTTINGLRLHYRQWGQPGRQPLVLLHASGCHAHWWDWVGPRLASAYIVIAPDLRGHGGEAPGERRTHRTAYAPASTDKECGAI
jgi:pimeloyl-ACP methyl ester carboxylesterase